MKNNTKRTGNKGRITRPPRAPERNSVIDGVYSNNYFMHAATSHIGTVVKVETTHGAVYEGVFKTFSHDFDVVLELAHQIDKKGPQKVNPSEIVDNLIFNPKDIVYMCALNVEPDYAFNSNSFQIDSSISKCNGEVTGEKDLQPWDDSVCNGEECDLETIETTQNGWDVHEMFQANEKYGVQTTYDESLADYTCQIVRKDTKDFKEDEAKAARIAMEIERNPSSQARSALENGENEEELFAAVQRPGNENESKYVPPAKRNSQHHRVTGGNTRGNYPSNGNQRSYNIPESPGRPPKNATASLPRYHHQAPQQYHQSTYGPHPSAVREGGNRSSPENKNQMCPSAVSQPPQNNSYSTNVHQQRSYPPNVVAGPNHSQNVPLQQSKSQRASPISVNTLPNGNAAEYQPKSLPPVTQSPPHQQYHSQNQQPQNSGGNVMNAQQRKHHQPHHHHANSRGREDETSELKQFSSNFNLPYEKKNKEAEAPKQIQVVTNRNKSPPVSQGPGPVAAAERNVVAVTIVSALAQNKYSTSSPTTPQTIMGAQPVTVANAHTAASPAPPSPAVTVVTTQGVKQHPLVLSQPTQYQQPLHLQHADQQVLLQHQPHMQQAHHHTQTLPPPPQQQPLMQQKPQKPVHQMPLQQPTVLGPMSQPPQSNVQIQQHPPTSQHAKTVMNTSGQNAPAPGGVAVQPLPVTTAGGPPPNTASTPQACNLPPNVHTRPPLQPQQSLKNQSPNAQDVSVPAAGEGNSEVDSGKSKEGDASVDDVSQRVKNVRLNPDAKEYVPAVKSFNPVSRSPSTPTQSRPHTPQTPSSYNIHPANAPVAAGIQMVMPTYVVAASPGYVPPPQAANRIRKAPVNSHRTPDFHPSNIPVSAVTGQPLLAPPVPLAQSHLGHGTSFSVPAYAHHPQLAAAPHYSPLQVSNMMVRMVQQGGMVPIVPSTISYHDSSGSNATAVYVNQGSGAAVAMAQHNPHVHHPQQHPPPSTAPSPSQTPQGPSQSHTQNSYQHPPMAQSYPPIMCPVIQAPPTHGPPHHMVATPAQQHAMQQYLSQHPSVTQQPHILSIIPHSCS